MEDRQLLKRFVDDNSQEAFAMLTARYLRLVYSVCCRELADAEAAEDVTQAVFLILARKASTLRSGVVLSGWLFQTARFASKNARIAAQRREVYEQKAAEVMAQQQAAREDANWAEVEPLLNQSLAGLRPRERECVLLRFFQGLSFSEVGSALGLSEEAARKRVLRALEKMQRFFSKEGVIVPSVILASLLTAHAAKAAPATCQASLTHLTIGAVAGQSSAALTGSYVYQLSEGVLKAMKIIQIKAAVGVSATLLLGLTTFTVAHGVAPLSPKPKRLLQQVPGMTFTADQIAARCRAAYAALESYQITAIVDSTSVTATDSSTHNSHTSAAIRYVRPGKIHVEGKDMSGGSFAYISDGVTTVEKDPVTNGLWAKAISPEMAIASVTGIAASAATTVPALLMRTNWGTPLALGGAVEPVAREDNIAGQAYYVLTAHLASPGLTQTEALWIDEKTFLVRRLVSDSRNGVQTVVIAGTSHVIPTATIHEEQQLTNEHLNEVIPESAFTLPAVR